MGIVAQHRVGPNSSVDLAIELERAGFVKLYLRGDTVMQCRCGHTHDLEVIAELGCGPDMNKSDLTDLEWAIRGNQEAGKRLGWRLLQMVVNSQRLPCEDGS